MSQKVHKQKKPGFSDHLYVLTDILCKNPVSEPPSGQLNVPYLRSGALKVKVIKDFGNENQSAKNN
jgi:hypothetical protein